MKRTIVDGTEFWAERDRNGLWVHFEGETWFFKNETTNLDRQKSGGLKGAVGGVVKAPMPGKITKVCKSVGAKVEAGEALVVMEAMKMEYTLKAEVAGQLAKVDCQVGDQVRLGQSLCLIDDRAGAT